MQFHRSSVLGDRKSSVVSSALRCTFLAAIMTIAGAVNAADSWPDFRGPRGDGHAALKEDAHVYGVPVKWSEKENVQWKTELPLLGLSSPVVMDGRVWLTTATEDGHDYFVICVDAETGKILANKKLFHSDDPQSLGNGRQDNSYATPSAVLEKGRAYVHFGSFGTACLDASTYEVIWKRDDMPCWHYRGASSSPVLFKDLLILTFDGADFQYHIALNKNTGETVWKTDRSANWNDEHVENQMVKDGDWRKGHSTPLIVEQNNKSRLFSVGAKAAYAYDPATGEELWRIDHEAYSPAPRPVYYQDHVMFVTGFSRGAQMCSVKTGGKGVVTDSHMNWKIKSPFPKYSSPILVDDLIYMALDDSFLACVEAKTGETVWKERVGGKFRACPIYVDGRLYFFSLEGVTTVLKPGRNFEVIATNRLAEDAPNDDPRRGPGFVASPAVVGKSLFLRTRQHLYRVEID
jgi:outer membrane protein assembly factor BamB